MEHYQRMLLFISLGMIVQSYAASPTPDEARVTAIIARAEEFYGPDSGVGKCQAWLRSAEGKEDVEFLTARYDSMRVRDRQTIAQHLAGTGFNIALPFLIRAFSDAKTGQAAMSNLIFSTRHDNKPEARFGLTLAPLVAAWTRPEFGTVKTREETIADAIWILPQLDLETARHTLCKDEFMSPASPWVKRTLSAFGHIHAKLPEERVNTLLSAWMSPALSPKATSDDIQRYASVLHALALTDPEKSLRLTVEIQRSKTDQTYLLGGIILEAHGLGEFQDLIFETLDDPDKFAALPIEAKRYVSALEILAIADEGIEQVFTTSAYDEWEYGIQGLVEVGQRHYVSFLRNVEQLFGPQGPPRNFKEREKAIMAMNPPLRNQIEKAYQAYAQDNTVVSEIESADTRYLLELYAAKHAEVLKRSVTLLKKPCP